MRERRFKGKRTDNGEWVKGGLLITMMSGCYILQSEIKVRKKDGATTFEEIKPYEVDPDTVGQGVELYGNWLYEGDIVEFECGEKQKGKIVFNQATCGFEIWYDTIVGPYGEKATKKINFAGLNYIKTIGNVWDNPDLVGWYSHES